MKKFNSFRNRQNGFEDLGSGTAEAAKTKKSWWKVPVTILVILVIAIFIFNSTYQIREQEQAVLITLGQAKAVTDPGLHFKIPFIQQSAPTFDFFDIQQSAKHTFNGAIHRPSDRIV